MNELHRREIRAIDLLDVGLSFVRKLYKSQHFTLLPDFSVAVLPCVEVDIAADPHEQGVLEYPPELECLVGDCPLVNADSTRVKYLDQVVALEAHLVDEVVVN